MEQEARKSPGVSREYATDAVTVYWEPKFCIHTANCLNAEPEVFDATRRPWIIAGAASPDRVAAAVMSCPTGALHFRRSDGGQQEPVPETTTIQPRVNGPLFVRGRLRFVDARGQVTREETRAALCRCGQSGNKPFCDGAHRAVGFRGS